LYLLGVAGGCLDIPTGGLKLRTLSEHACDLHLNEPITHVLSRWWPHGRASVWPLLPRTSPALGFSGNHSRTTVWRWETAKRVPSTQTVPADETAHATIAIAEKSESMPEKPDAEPPSPALIP